MLPDWTEAEVEELPVEGLEKGGEMLGGKLPEVVRQGKAEDQKLEKELEAMFEEMQRREKGSGATKQSRESGRQATARAKLRYNEWN